MAGIRLEWAQFGDFDTFDIYRSLTSINPDALPSPIVTGLVKMVYEDATIIEGVVYYYRIIARRGAEYSVSSEIYLAAIPDDSSFAQVGILLPMNSLADIKRGVSLVKGLGNPVYTSTRFGQSMVFTGDSSYYFHRVNNVVAAEVLTGSAFTIEFYAALTESSVGTCVPLSYGAYYEADAGQDLSWWIGLNKTNISFAQSRAGAGNSTDSIGGTLPVGFAFNNMNHYAITKYSDGLTVIFVEGEPIASKMMPLTFHNGGAAGVCVGRLNFSGYEYPFVGTIGPIRTTKGLARYPSVGFTPPNYFQTQ